MPCCFFATGVRKKSGIFPLIFHGTKTPRFRKTSERKYREQLRYHVENHEVTFYGLSEEALHPYIYIGDTTPLQAKL